MTIRKEPRQWRLYFYAALSVGAVTVLWLGRQGEVRSLETRTMCVAAWIAAAVLYAALAWKTRAAGREWRPIDIVMLAILALVALYEAHWPDVDLHVTPDGIAMIWAGSAFGSVHGTMWRKRREQRAAKAA